MSVIANISGNATVQDSSTNYGPNIALALASAGLSAYSYLLNESISTSPNSITFPFGVTQLQFVFVQNTGQNTLQVTWTPQGGSSNVVLKLTPSGKPGVSGGAIMFLEPDLTLGISALSLTAISAATNATVVIAG
jgi:hypothetical protein